MFFSLVKYRMKAMLLNLNFILWTLLFPMLISLFFYFTHSDRNYNIQESISIGLVDQGDKDELLYNSLSQMILDKEKIFSISYVDYETAQEKLNKEEIAAFIDVDDNYHLYLEVDGVQQNIIATVLSRYLQEVPDDTRTCLDSGEIISLERKENVSMVNQKEVYFGALLTMGCLFCMLGGLKTVTELNAKKDMIGARIMASAVSRRRIYGANYLAVIIVCNLELFIQLAFYTCVLQIKFGKYPVFAFLTCFIGGFISICLGSIIALYVKGSVIRNYTMTGLLAFGGSFLTGVMMTDVKYFLETNFSFLSKVVPGNLICNALVSLCRENGMSDYKYNMKILAGESLLLVVFLCWKFRRNQYADC